MSIEVQGHVRIFQDTELVYAEKNIIVLGIKHLFSRMFKDIQEPMWAVWGLALGAGDDSWGTGTPPDPTVNQDAILQPLIRKPISKSQWVDEDFNPSATPTNRVEYQTLINSTTDGLILPNGDIQPVREMGLIGGGSRSGGTNPNTALYWNSVTNLQDSVTLINYKTLPPLLFPAGVTFMVSWTLTF